MFFFCSFDAFMVEGCWWSIVVLSCACFLNPSMILFEELLKEV